MIRIVFFGNVNKSPFPFNEWAKTAFSFCDGLSFVCSYRPVFMKFCFNYFMRSFFRDLVRIFSPGNGNKGFSMFHIWTETTKTNKHFLSFIFRQSAWQLEKLNCFLQCNSFNGLSLTKAGKCRLLIFTHFFSRPDLYHWSKPGHLSKNG